MRRITRSHLAGAIPFLATACMFGSCTIDPLRDEFNKTIWTATEVPLGPLSLEIINIEFTEDQAILSDGEGNVIAEGCYDNDGRCAIFRGMSTVIDGIAVTFVEAHLSNGILFLLWRPEDILYPFTTAMKRKG